MPPPAAKSDAPASHPHFRPHVMQGWSPDFIPGLVQKARDENLIDEIQPVPGGLAFKTAADLARKEGILAGTTGGATVAGALLLAERLPAGSRILAMLPDTGERYLSTPLFADIAADMDEEESSISRSSPGWRFDVAPPPAAPVAIPVPTPFGKETVETILSDTNAPVVMFALEWCEFCWAVRRFFKSIGVTYRSIDLDTTTWQQENRGGEVRTALHAKIGQSTIPQVFVGGQWIGGCTDTFASWRSGKLQQLLAKARVPFAPDVVTDPSIFLPGWMIQK